MWDKIIKYLAMAGGAVAGALGEWNVMLTVLACMMALDYLSGLMVAASGKSPKSETGGISSKVGADGLRKKGVIIIIVFVATLLDWALGTDQKVFQLAATGYYIANEGISILENASLLGVPFPKIIRNAFEAMRKKGDGGDGEPPETNE